MKSIIHLLFFIVAIFLVSCSEGDIIEDRIISDFETINTLRSCENDSQNNFVYYKIKDNNTEALVFNFNSSAFSETPSTIAEEPIVINLNGTTNSLFYRRLNATIDDTYFCASIPPANITVSEELISESGTAEITVTLEETATEKIYTTTIKLLDITLEGEGKSIRQEFLEFGSKQVVVID